MQQAGAHVSKEVIDMSAPEAQHNGSDARSTLASRPPLMGMTVRLRHRLESVNIDRLVNLE